MILLRLSTKIKDVAVEIEGEANTLEEIQEAWEAFILTTYRVENGHNPEQMNEMFAREINLTRSPVGEIIEVL